MLHTKTTLSIFRDCLKIIPRMVTEVIPIKNIREIKFKLLEHYFENNFREIKIKLILKKFIY